MSSSLKADDPLAGILSDGSDDSFFDEPKNLTKRSSLTKTPEKKVVSDLFNLSDDKVDQKKDSAAKMEDDWLGISKSKDSGIEAEKVSSSNIPIKPSKKISFEDDDDILSTLGLGKKVTTEKLEEKKPPETSKKLDLLESILGPPKEEQKKFTSFEDVLKESKAMNPPKSAEIKSQPSSISIKTESQHSIGQTSLDALREGRRGRRSSGGLLDPLGLFANETKRTEVNFTESEPKMNKDQVSHSTGVEAGSAEFKKELSQAVKMKDSLQAKSVAKGQDSGLPDWLGGSIVKPPTPTKQVKPQTVLPQRPPTPNVDQQSQEQVPKDNITTPVMPSIEGGDSQILPSLLAQQKLAHSNIEYQNTAMALQQQESQLLMALQLKKYEENLAAMQQHQQEILVKQEQQFNLLLERQFARQQAMENSMKLQQERISNHIQLLLSQPAAPKSLHQEEIETLEKTAKDENSKLYENMLNSLKQRQHEEIFLLEESYKKQISLLEQTMESIENRLRSEVTKIAENYEDRLKQMKQEHEEEMRKSADRLRELEQYHNDELKQVRDNHNRIIDEIKYEYSTMIETIKNSKQDENNLFSNANAYAEKLDSNMQVLYSNSKTLQDIQDKVYKDYGVLSVAREETLKVKEQEIAAMRATLDKCRETAELERSQLMGLVRSLEMKLSEQTQSAKEDRWAFQQAAATLAARSAALDRESEFNRNAIKREQEQLKTLKETLLAEQEKMMLQLTEEKLALAAEKSRIETASRLTMNYDTQRSKAEIDAALQVAREAAEQTEREREKLHRQQIELDSLKRSLKEKERMLNMRENEIRNIRQNAERKGQEGERRMQEARSIEMVFSEKYRELQSQLDSIGRREKKLAEEKISLSKERLALHTMMRQFQKCSLCAVNQPKQEESSYHEYSHHDAPRYITNMDPELVRLRMEATEDEQAEDTVTAGNISI